MEEATIKNKITAALGDIRAPQDLVERTAARAQAIESGREAEKQLAELGDKHPDRMLVARSIVGRLMLTSKMPPKASAAAMAETVAKDQRLQALVDAPASRLLNDLRSGKLIGQFAAGKENVRHKSVETPVVKKEGPSLPKL